MFDDQYLVLLNNLIKSPSLSPDDQGLQNHIYKHLESFIDNHSLGHITICRKTYNEGGTTNNHFIIKPKNSISGNNIGFVGHTDVVPVQKQYWDSDPFSLVIKNEMAFGRGIVDMKGAIACYICALEHFLLRRKKLDFNIHLFLTSDEEGSGQFGLQKIFENYVPDNFQYIVIGEPTSVDKIGDFIKIGRRGSVHGNITLLGQQYHVAYPGFQNPIKILPEVLSMLSAIKFTQNNSSAFIASNLEVTSIKSEETVENIIPGKIAIRFNVRNTPDDPLEKIRDQLCIELQKITGSIEFDLQMRQGGRPWLGTLSKEKLEILLSHVDYQVTTKGGLSDGWKVFESGITNIFELGLKHKTAHRHNEYADLTDLHQLSSIYYNLLENSS